MVQDTNINRILNEGFTAFAQTESVRSTRQDFTVVITPESATKAEEELTIKLPFADLVERASDMNYHDGWSKDRKHVMNWNPYKQDYEAYNALDWWNTLGEEGQQDIIEAEVKAQLEEAQAIDWYVEFEKGNVNIEEHPPVLRLYLLSVLQKWASDKMNEIVRRPSSVAA